MWNFKDFFKGFFQGYQREISKNFLRTLTWISKQFFQSEFLAIFFRDINAEFKNSKDIKVEF